MTLAALFESSSDTAAVSRARTFVVATVVRVTAFCSFLRRCTTLEGSSSCYIEDDILAFLCELESHSLLAGRNIPGQFGRIASSDP
jgi:hypothetical protein